MVLFAVYTLLMLQAFGKLCWSFVLALFAAVAAGQIYSLISSFNTSPYFISSVTLSIEQEQKFPDVTVCNINRVKKSKVDVFL